MLTLQTSHSSSIPVSSYSPVNDTTQGKQDISLKSPRPTQLRNLLDIGDKYLGLNKVQDKLGAVQINTYTECKTEEEVT
ncbi:unnamed protein product [Sphenostylis stenocarpa]|uniref:Uncharacterized protein n=1 Tax=Sphenostylis stenocarpa TaxID=92480 RepID=A0AA86SJ40_9FABA|nr:unnamed protein product [Sphenostylis stenocarpa]